MKTKILMIAEEIENCEDRIVLTSDKFVFSACSEDQSGHDPCTTSHPDHVSSSIDDSARSRADGSSDRGRVLQGEATTSGTGEKVTIVAVSGFSLL